MPRKEHNRSVFLLVPVVLAVPGKEVIGTPQPSVHCPQNFTAFSLGNQPQNNKEKH
jgi:hypothetical protein